MNAGHKRDALLRLKTVRGHLDGVIRMVEAEAYCPELMKQVAAAQASLERVNRILLQNHLETCVTEAIQTGGGHRQDCRADRRSAVQRRPYRLQRARRAARSSDGRLGRQGLAERLSTKAPEDKDGKDMSATDRLTATEAPERLPARHNCERDPVCGMAVDPAASPRTAPSMPGTAIFSAAPRCRETLCRRPGAVSDAGARRAADARRRRGPVDLPDAPADRARASPAAARSAAWRWSR